MESSKDKLTVEQFGQALTELDKEITKSKNLRKISPIRIVAVGGYVSIKYLKNRGATEDIDYILDPRIENQIKTEEKLQVAINKVAESNHYSVEWLNSRVSIFATPPTCLPLFLESVAQDVVLWRGKNLIIYAVKWEWSLARKLKRIGSTNREIDKSDAVALLHEINTRNGTPLDRQVAKGWNTVVYTPIEDHVLDEVARLYKERYGYDGFVEASNQ